MIGFLHSLSLTFPSQSALFGVVCTFIFTIWLFFNAQMAMDSGEIHYETKPVSIEGCQYEYELPQFTPLANGTKEASATEAT